MVGSVDVGHLMDVAVFLGFLQDIKSLFLCDIVCSSGLDCVVSHIADLDTPVLLVVGASLADLHSGITAGTDTGGEMSVVFLQPVRDLLEAD